jgi:hypothetical protein
VLRPVARSSDPLSAQFAERYRNTAQRLIAEGEMKMARSRAYEGEQAVREQMSSLS